MNNQIQSKKIGNSTVISIPNDLLKNDNKIKDEYDIVFLDVMVREMKIMVSLLKNAVKVYQKKIDPDFFLINGDNYYDNGVSDINSLLFEKCFVKPYANIFPEKYFFPILGNHDYGENLFTKLKDKLGLLKKQPDPNAQVNFSNMNVNWYMSGRYYSIEEINKLFSIYCIDSNTILQDLDQMDWLKNSVNNSKAKWKILVSHHPAITNGHHSKEPDVTGLNEFIIINKLYEKINLFISAHEHNNQILPYINNSFQIIVGNCSAKHPHKVNSKNGLIHFSHTPKDSSFGILKINNDNIICEIQTKNIDNYFKFDYNIQCKTTKYERSNRYLKDIFSTHLAKFDSVVTININPLQYGNDQLDSNLRPRKMTEREKSLEYKKNWLNAEYKPQITPNFIPSLSDNEIGSKKDLLNELRVKVIDAGSKWEKNSKIDWALRYKDLKKIDSRVNEALSFAKGKNSFSEGLIWIYVKNIVKDLYLLFSDVNFYCLKIIDNHAEKKSKRDTALHEMKADVKEIFKILCSLLIAYYFNQEKVDSRKCIERALMDLNLFEIECNKSRAIRGYKSLTKIKFEIGHPNKFKKNTI